MKHRKILSLHSIDKEILDKLLRDSGKHPRGVKEKHPPLSVVQIVYIMQVILGIKLSSTSIYRYRRYLRQKGELD